MLTLLWMIASAYTNAPYTCMSFTGLIQEQPDHVTDGNTIRDMSVGNVDAKRRIAFRAETFLRRHIYMHVNGFCTATAVRRTSLKLLLFSWSALISAPVVGAQELASPEHVRVIGFNFGDRPLSRWNDGLLLSLAGDNAELKAFDRQGQLVIDTHVSVPSAQKVLTYDTAALGDYVVVSGTAYNDTNSPASFIAWLDRASGRTERIVRTDPFTAIRIAFAPDGTLWAFGRQREENFREQVQYDMLRQYDAKSGALKQLALPRSSITRSTGPHPAFGAFIAAGQDRIVLVTRQQDWIEVSFTGELLYSAKATSLGDGKLSGLAVNDHGVPYVSIVRKDGSKDGVGQVFQGAPGRGWMVVSQEVRRVLGVDGNHLVTAVRFPELQWRRLK